MRALFLNVRKFWSVAIVVFVAGAFPATGAAQDRLTTWALGVRGGIGGDPTQTVVGAHVESPEVSAPGHLFFRPAIEFGWGNDLTVVTGNFDVLYRADFPGSSWALMFGAGPLIAYEKESDDTCPGTFECDLSDTEGGFSAIVGVRHKTGLSIEFRASDRGHSFAALAGYTFGRR